MGAQPSKVNTPPTPTTPPSSATPTNTPASSSSSAAASSSSAPASPVPVPVPVQPQPQPQLHPNRHPSLAQSSGSLRGPSGYTIEEEEELKQTELNRLGCERDRNKSLAGSTWLIGCGLFGAFITALAPNHWPLRTRAAPYLMLSVVGFGIDYYETVRICRENHPIPKHLRRDEHTSPTSDTGVKKEAIELMRKMLKEEEEKKKLGATTATSQPNTNK